MTDLRFGEFEVDGAAEQLRRDGETVHLEPRIFHLLVYLLEHRDRLVTKQDLNEIVWHGAFVTDNAVDRAVARLRKALGDDVHAPRFIQTVPTRGYRFVAQVEVDGERSGEPTSLAPAVPSRVEGPAPAAAAIPAGPTPIAPARAARAQLRRTLKLVVLLLCTVPLLGVLLIALRSPDPPVAANAPAESDRVVARQLTTAQAFEFAPSFSPDGASLAYTSNRSGATSIWIRSLAPGGRDRQLAETAGARVAAWSPDGRFIAYDTYQGIWIVPPTGGSPRQIVEHGGTPRWSPDAGTIVFQTSIVGVDTNSWAAIPRSTLWTTGLDGAPPRQLTHQDEPSGGHGHPAFSPNGRRVTFVTSTFGRAGELWTVSAEGGDLRRLLTGCQCRDPIFAADGESVYYNDFVDSQYGLWRIAASGEGAPLRIYEAPLRFLSLARDGRKLAASRHQIESGLWSMAVDPQTAAPAGAPAPLLSEEFDRNKYPACSPDSHRIAFIVTRAGNRTELWMASPAGGAAEQLAAGALDGWPAWSDDSSQVYFVNDDELQRIDVATRRVETVLRTDLEWQTPAVAPGGRGVAFALADASGISNIWALDTAGRARQITREATDTTYPVWSPDGRWLAVELDRERRTAIGYISAEGGEVVELAGGAEECYTGGWSPDGDKIVFPCRPVVEGPKEHWGLWWVSRTTGERRPLTDRPLHVGREFVRYPTWSPAGDRIFFELAQSRADLWLLELPGQP